MSMPVEGQPAAIQQQAYSSYSGNGSIGPVIAVLVVISVLGVAAVIIGRLCAGRSFVGGRRLDFEGWVERKFASCIDGRIENSSSVNGGGPVTTTVEATPESKHNARLSSLNSASRV